MDVCVKSLLGMKFLSSFEDSVEAHRGNYIFKYVDKWIEDIESEKVIQVLTDNPSNNMVRRINVKEEAEFTLDTMCHSHT